MAQTPTSFETLPIQLNLGASNLRAVEVADQRLEHDAACEGREHGAIARGRIVEKIHRLKAPGPDHVLDHDRRIAGNVPPEIPAKLTGIDVVAAAGTETHQDADRLAGEEWAAVGRAGGRG